MALLAILMRRLNLLIKESGYSCALTTVRGTNNAISDLYELKRFGVDNTDLNSFIVIYKWSKILFPALRNIIIR